MRKRTHSILEEIGNLIPQKDRENVVETRAANIISSAVTLLTYIRENYNAEQYAELERRFLASIKSGDSAKFSKSIKKLKESKNANNYNLNDDDDL